MNRYTGLFRLYPIPGSSSDGFIMHDKELIKYSVINIIKTPKGSRVYDPEYGTNIHKLLFELNIQRVRNIAKAEIREAIEKYEPRAVILDVNAYAGQTANISEVVLVVRIEYTEFDGQEDLELRLQKETDWISTEGRELDPVEEWFTSGNK